MLAMGRALMSQPKLLLLDEPFASLGPALRDDMLDLLADLHNEKRMTVLFVTHQPEDAGKVAHNVIFLESGHIAATGQAGDFFGGHAPEAFKRYIGT